MPTPRETILAALHARLSALPATALRGEVLPERIPTGGLLILRDGEPGEPEVTLSPLAWHYQHRAEIEAVVQGADRDIAFDTICASIGAALAADRTLGGLCDWVEAEAPRPVDLPVEGAASLKAAVIPIVLHYALSDTLAEVAASPEPAPEPPPDWPADTVALWLIFGQSNAEGYAPWRQDPAKADPAQAVAFLSAAERDFHPWMRLSSRGAGATAGRFEQQGIATDTTPRTSGKVWTTGANGIPPGTASFGPEIGLVRHVLGGGDAANWREDAAPRLYVLKQTEGGRSVDHFRWGGPGQDLILTALRQSAGETLTTLAAAKTVLLQGIIFVIGEKDSTTLHPSGASMAESLDVRFADWVRQIRAALGADVPAVFVEIHDAVDARKQVANAKLAALAATIPNAAVIARDPSWDTVGDGIHYDAAAQAAIGDAVFAHFRQACGRPGDGLVTGFPFTGLRPWFHVPPLFIDDGGTNMRVAATPAASGTIHALVTDAGAPVPDAAAIRDASSAAPGFRKPVTADQEALWWSGSGVFQSNTTQDCHFVLEDASGRLGEVATVRRWANAKFAPDLALVSTSGGAASFSVRPSFTGDLSWALHDGARAFMRPEDVETAAFAPVDAGQLSVAANTDVQIDVTGLTPGQEYTLLVTGRKNGAERSVTQSATVIAA